MYFEYWIKRENKWYKVDFDTYFAFDGEKERRPSTWRTIAIQQMLGIYR